MQTTLRIDDELHRAAKAEAARQGITLTSFIEEALREKVRQQSKDAQKRQKEVQERDRLMERLLKATTHFRVGPRPTREEMNAR